MTAEVWRQVSGFPGLYEISDLGRIRSIDHIAAGKNRWGVYDRHVKGKILTTSQNNCGYPQVTLCDGHGGRFQRTIHSIVAEAFLGPRPEGMDVLHRDGRKINCRATNLKHGYPIENSSDAIKHGHQVRGERQGSARLTEKQVRKIILTKGMTTNETAATKLGVSKGAIAHIRRRETWRHIKV